MKKNAFTLIELLIAISIFSVVVLALYSAFNTGILSYRQIDSSLNTYEAARLALTKIESDLKNSFAYSSSDSMFKGTFNNLDFYSVSSDLLRIKYLIENNLLIREVYKNLYALEANPVGQKQILTADTKEISFEYAYPVNSPDKPYDWQDIWPKQGDTSQQKTLPEAVKIKLTMNVRGRGAKKEISLEFNKLVSLPSSEYPKKLFSGIRLESE